MERFSGTLAEVSSNHSTRGTATTSGIRRWLVALALACAALLVAARAWSDEPKSRPKATSSRAVREEAKGLIPYDKLSRDNQSRVAAVLADTTMFRRLPIEVIECDPKLYLFLVEHPELVVNIWEVLGISEVALRRTGSDTFKADDGEGTVGNVQFLYRSHDLHVVYAEGSYDGPLFNRPVRGQCVCVLKTGYVREPDGRYYVTCRLDAFLRMQHTGIELLTKTFQPLVGSVADHNFRETTGFVASLSRAAEMNHAGLETIAGKLEHVTPEARDQFSAITREIAVRSAALGAAPRPTAQPASIRKPEMQVNR